jgi:hypothetical protein
VIAALAALAVSAQAAQAQPAGQPPCMTLDEVRHGTLFILPSLVDGLTEQCRPALAPNAYLLTAGAERSKQLAAERNAHWEKARGAIVRLAGEKQAGAFTGDTVAMLVRDMIKAESGKAIKPADCASIDRALSLLAPLPDQNIAELVALGVEAGMRADAARVAAAAGKGKKATASAPFALCPAAAPAAGGQ